MNAFERLWEGIKDVFDGVYRTIKDVASWDGAASNYSGTPEYCDACLINVNAAAGKTAREDWTQDHCMLPVREAGDPAGTYVRQAVHAVAGGRGITQVKRPGDVPEDAWNAAVKAAANKVIAAYGQMDEVAPDSIYELAGKTPPERERDLSLSQMAEQIMGQIDGIGMSAGAWPMVNDFYTEEDGTISVVFSMSGKLYKAPVTMSGTNAILGSLTEVETMFAPVRSIEIIRQSDGKVRWLAVAAASVLNRVGEIDSRSLFDSFITNVKPHGYPQLRFYHDARLVMGRADFVDRADNLYIASGLTDGGELAEAFVDACEKHRGVWGCSIGFMPTKQPQMVEIANGIEIPVYTEGVNTEISVLPEDSAASWFTSIGLEVTRNMEDAKVKALAVLLGDEEKAKKFAEGVDGTNRSIAEKGLVTRKTEVDPDATEQLPPTAEEDAAQAARMAATRSTTGHIVPPGTVVVDQLSTTVVEERHATTEVEKEAKTTAELKAKEKADLLTEFVEKAGIAGLSERLTKVEEALAQFTKGDEERSKSTQASIANLATLAQDITRRVSEIDVTVTRWQQERAADMPRNLRLQATYRPREQGAVAEANLSSLAEATLSALKSK